MKRMRRMGFLALIMLILASMPFAVYAADGQIKIAQTSNTSFPIIIDQPGSYVLTSNLKVETSGTIAIKIDTDNVVLDLNGHTIQCTRSSGTGISVSGKYNISIKNGTISGFGNGVYLYTYTNDDLGGGRLIENIHVRLNGIYGILAYYTTIINCSAERNTTGMQVHYSNLKNCSANHNSGFGIKADYSSLTNCTATGNGNIGFNVSLCSLTNCTSSHNKLHGIYGWGSLLNCTSTHNGDDTHTIARGIYFAGGTITSCFTTRNKSDGIYASGATVVNCVVRENGGDGIETLNSLIKGCNVRGNSGVGIKSSNSTDDSYIYGNRSYANGGGDYGFSTNCKHFNNF